jgi:hypothetical protein
MREVTKWAKNREVREVLHHRKVPQAEANRGVPKPRKNQKNPTTQPRRARAQLSRRTENLSEAKAGKVLRTAASTNIPNTTTSSRALCTSRQRRRKRQVNR